MDCLITFPDRNWAQRIKSLLPAILSSIACDEQVWTPPLLTPGNGEAIRVSGVIEALRRFLRPAPTEWCITRVGALLAHYPSFPKIIPHLEMILGDWIKTLADLPEEAISAACQAVLERSSPWQPVPGEVRALAMEHVAEARRTLHKLEAMLAVSPPEHVVVEILWPLVRRREIRRADVDILIRPLSVTVHTEHLVGRMREGHPGLRSPGERGRTESLLRRSADHLKRESCYLIGPNDPEPSPPTPEAREATRARVAAILAGMRVGPQATP
ncbi:MAG: hypothetical protein FD149_1677 [Rhodospirillaceae bacterium]|nr:MAG: hypothetical protein FD149_1677 [Rhodospirillaceae bacterium]